jgi:hypothetical protein
VSLQRAAEVGVDDITTLSDIRNPEPVSGIDGFSNNKARKCHKEIITVHDKN